MDGSIDRRHGLLAAFPNNLICHVKDKGPPAHENHFRTGGNPPPSMAPAHGIHSHVIILVLTPLPSLAIHVFGDAHRVLGLHI